MKKIFLLLPIIFYATLSFADEGVQLGQAAKDLAKDLNGKTLVCVASSSNSKNDKFPVRVTAKTEGDQTQLTITSSSPEGFGNGGDILDETEESANWYILGSGDDGREHLMFQKFDLQDSKCSVNNGKYSGDIAGTLTSIWDAGTIDSEGVQCCIE